MAILGGGRSNDSTLVSSIDDVIQELELDLCQILGMEAGQPVNASVFGTGQGIGGDGFAVQADGSIRSIMRFTLGAVANSPNSSCGFEFADGSESYRIVIVNSELRVYKLETGTWVQVANLSVPITQLVELDDVDMPVLDATVDDYRVVIDTTTVPGEHSFKLAQPAAAEDVRILSAVDITLPLDSYINHRLTLFKGTPGDPEEFFVGYDPAGGGGGGGPYYMGELIDAPTIPVPVVAADAGAVIMQGFGAQADTIIQNRPLLGAGGGTFDCEGEETVGTFNWQNVNFNGPFDNTNGWRSGEFFSDTSQIITMPEPGFYFVKYVIAWPKNSSGSYRAHRLVLNSGANSELGQRWRLSPSYTLRDGGAVDPLPPPGEENPHVSNNDPLVTFDFIRVGSPTTLRLQVAHDAGNATVVLSVTASVGFVKIR